MNRRGAVSWILALSICLFTVGIVEAKTTTIEKLIQLTGIGTGKARYRVSGTNRNFKVEVENLKSRAGKTLIVKLVSGGNTVNVGTIKLSRLGAGSLELESQRSPNVPVVSPGNVVSVVDGNTTLLTGTF